MTSDDILILDAVAQMITGFPIRPAWFTSRRYSLDLKHFHRFGLSHVGDSRRLEYHCGLKSWLQTK